jgi:hypothetical protein
VPLLAVKNGSNINSKMCNFVAQKKKRKSEKNSDRQLPDRIQTEMYLGLVASTF